MGREEGGISWASGTASAKALSTAVYKALCLVLGIYRDKRSLASTLKLLMVYVGDRKHRSKHNKQDTLKY